MSRGFSTIEHLRARSIIDPVSRCWHWQGAKINGQARIWTLDLDRVEKTVLNGARAVWFIAHGTQLHHLQAWMGCGTADCVCPVHVRRGTRSEWTHFMSATGRMRREATPGRVAAAAKGRAMAGHLDTQPEVVLAIRAAHAAGEASAVELVQRHGIGRSVVYRILRGETYRHLLPAQVVGGGGIGACAR